jgi:hypothetical protein
MIERSIAVIHWNSVSISNECLAIQVHDYVSVTLHFIGKSRLIANNHIICV